jgi:RNA polymerase sigma-70 factor (ECF subfamily)
MELAGDELLEKLALDLMGHFPQLVLAYQNWMYAFVLRQTGNRVEAEDVLQEVFLQVYVTLENYPASRIRSLKLRPWLSKIALYVYYNSLRKKRVHEASLDLADESQLLEIEGDPLEEPEAYLERVERLQELSTLLLTLPEQYRTALNCYYFAELSYQEIADLLHQPLGTVKSNIHRGLRLLRGHVARSKAG